ncbi:hypothetical protein N657DRAFT_656437 [Parathielavia appendiculata]|uniref:Uncharacterized protein n=1 Tax=Parathielavia appendiculata TaxID=2587402 RepID=A0AAN6Z313_9PEZI|nr:hypothetical protein N657DRAFT_656437 [Parathielavia appendiculata]
MIVRDLKRLALVVGPLLVLLLLSASLWHSHSGDIASHVGSLLGQSGKTETSSTRRTPTLTADGKHYEIYSLSTPDGKYFDIRFGIEVFNPNIIPHQKFNNTWYIVGQVFIDPNDDHTDKTVHEAGCVAQFINGVLMCIDYVQHLPIEPTPGGKCTGDFAYINFNVGPHDARVFMGPQSPFIIYGSNSAFTCFGQFIQDFRKLVNWEYELMTPDDFAVGTEIERPPPYAQLEKNYFAFWDNKGDMLVHYDLYPKRGFGKLERNGTVGPDLAPRVKEHDEKCLKRYMPELPGDLESIHQATNSMKVTMCNRADKSCEPHDGNTYIMTIAQHKTYYNWHSEYEPYVVLFQQRAPYELYAISKKPLWIHGRQRHEGRRTDMMYVTSANWKDHGVNYHGFLDDVVFLGFGYEDKHSAGIDVLAADLLHDIGRCDDP